MEEHYEWELQAASGEWVAGGSANEKDAVHREGMSHLATYLQYGPHILTIRKHQVLTVIEATIPTSEGD